MTASPSNSSPFKVRIRVSRAYRLMTVALVGLLVVVAPLAVIGALVAAVMNFADGAIVGGVLMLIMAAVLTVVLLVPVFFFWRRLLGKRGPLNLVISQTGFILFEGERTLRRLEWERVASVRLSSSAKKGTERLVISAMWSGQKNSGGRDVRTWMDLPLSKMDGERGDLIEALARHSRGLYTAGR